ncbi:MAG: hypothetical protein LBH25_05715 [Fibromonadaceae bacterium]|nr:hypothetical protein [Fibromonadaceae bacterium]
MGNNHGKDYVGSHLKAEAHWHETDCRNGYWWTSSGSGTEAAYYSRMGFNYSGAILNTDDKNNKMSVRCISDLME